MHLFALICKFARACIHTHILTHTCIHTLSIDTHMYIDHTYTHDIHTPSDVWMIVTQNSVDKS